VARKKNHSAVSISITTFFKKVPEKFGFLKRFIDWIARGADESGISGKSCPT